MKSMNRIIILLSLSLFFCLNVAAQSDVTVTGSVSNCFTMEGVPEAIVYITNVNDTLRVAECKTKYKLVMEQRGNDYYGYLDKNLGATFKLSVNKIGDYNLHIVAEGYIQYVRKLGTEELKNKHAIDLGEILLQPEPKQYNLEEVVISTTKIKLFYKGDTVVYNADAFDIAQSETLRALIEQLPGTEFRDGRVYVNGRYVENLLLNGKNFFNGNIVAALDNLPAYIVDKVKVYDRSGELTEMTGKDMFDSEYVMDVTLKREYVGTWLAQAEAGLGNKKRYSGLGFLMRVDDRQMFTLNTDINNINLNREQTEVGRSTNRFTNGYNSNKAAKFTYYIEPNRKFRLRGNAEIRLRNSDTESWNNSESFISPNNLMKRSVVAGDNSGNTIKAMIGSTIRPFRKQRYEITYDLTYSENISDSWRRSISYFMPGKDIWVDMGIDSIYDSELHSGNSLLLNATTSPFQSEQEEINHKVSFATTFAFGVNILGVRANVNHNKIRRYAFENYNINYLSDGKEENLQRYHTSDDYSLQSDATIDFILKYADSEKHNGQITTYLTYSHNHGDNSHPYYRLDNLKYIFEGALWDTGSIGVLPGNDMLELCLDNQNSYYSDTYNNTGILGMELTHKEHLSNNTYASIKTVAEILYSDRTMDYRRGGTNFHIEHNAFQLKPSVRFEWYPCKGDSKGSISRLSVYYKGVPQTPQMLQMLTVRDDSDPLNIFYGNNRLKDEFQHTAGVDYNYNWVEKGVSIGWDAAYGHKHNDIVTKSTFNPINGVRTYTPVNTSKTHSVTTGIRFMSPLDKDRNAYLHISLLGGYSQHANFVSLNDNNNSIMDVTRIRFIAPDIRIQYRWNKINTTLSFNTNFSRTKSFGTYNDYLVCKCKFNLGWNLPYGFKFSSELEMQKYTGNRENSLNEFIPIWNMKLVKSMLNKKLDLSINAYDVLAKSNGLQIVIDENGRREMWQKRLTQYFIVTLGYRINWSEKKTNNINVL